MRTTNASIRVATLTASISRRAGGLFHSVRQLNHAVCQCGVDGHVFSLRDNFTDIDCSAWNGADLTVCDVRGPQAFGFSPNLKREVLLCTAELLHLHGIWMYPSWVSLQWNRLRRKPVMISPRGMLEPWALRNSQWKKKLAGWVYENRNLRSAACIHALCQSEYESIRAYGLKNPVCIIPNGVDLPQDGPRLAPPWTGTIESGRKVILFLGRIHPKKGLSNLIEAWSRLRQLSGGIVSEWALVIAGWSQGGHEDDVKRMVHEKGLTQDIIFMGPAFDDAKKACLQNADAFVLPSFSEGLPMSILEAWSYRLPVLMTDACNIPEGFRTRAAIEIEPNVPSIVDGLRTFFQLPAPRQRELGENGRELVKRDFTWERVGNEMVSVYKWLASQGDQPACVRSECGLKRTPVRA